MADETFETFVQRERARLHGEREAIFTQQKDLQNKLASLNRELQAIDAYESAKTGKRISRGGESAAEGRRPRQGRRGSKREELLRVIREGHGLSRGEILEKMGLKGNKTGEMSVSNALTALSKASQVRRESGKYHAA